MPTSDKPKVIYCGDNGFLCRTMDVKLSKEGYDGVALPSGEAGLKVLQTMRPEERKNTVLMADNDMEKTGNVMQGHELIARVQKDFPEVGIVLTGERLTEKSNGWVIDDMPLHMLTCQFLPKPWELSKITAAIDNAAKK